MKKVLLSVMVLGLLAGTHAVAKNAVGSAFGTVSTAHGIGMGNASFQGVIGIADATTVSGAFRYGFSDYLDGRLKLGLYDGDEDAEIVFGADMTFQVWTVSQQSRNPIELAFGGMFEFVSPGDATIWQLGGYSIGSYPFLLNNGMTLSPYGRLNIRVENYSIDYPDDFPLDDADDSELEFGFNGGAMLRINETINAYGEFQIDGNDGVFFGIEFLVM